VYCLPIRLQLVYPYKIVSCLVSLVGQGAAIREFREETAMHVSTLEQLHVASDPLGDPRRHTVSIAFRARIDDEKSMEPASPGGDDAARTILVPIAPMLLQLPLTHTEPLESPQSAMTPAQAATLTEHDVLAILSADGRRWHAALAFPRVHWLFITRLLLSGSTSAPLAALTATLVATPPRSRMQ
jgi:hypothetical protein